MASVEGEDAADELHAVLALQSADLELDQLRHRREHLEERARLAGLRARREQLVARLRPLVGTRAELAARQAAVEKEVDEATSRARSIEERLQSGTVASFRDQEAMGHELEALARRRSDLEDGELVVMEELEAIEDEIGAIERAIGELDDQIAVTNHDLEVAESEVDADIAAATERRLPLAAAISSELFDEYERLRTHLGGIGAARVENGLCSGCNLALSAIELDEIRHHPGALHHCEQCGRILVA